MENNINFVRVPSHLGIQGNEEENKVAKKSINGSIKDKIGQPYDFKAHIKNEIHR